MSNYNKYDKRIYSYMTLRQTVGWIGICLPLVLFLYSKLFVEGGALEPSISHYYYTLMRNLFVGALCAVGLFMFFYAGYSRLDDLTGDLAGVCAIVTAWFPTSPIVGEPEWYNHLHLPFAAGLFACFAFFSLWLFTQSKAGRIYKRDEDDPSIVYIAPREISHMKKMRNRIYIICGFGIIACLITMATYIIVQNGNGGSSRDSSLIYWLEFTALVLFGFSWLTKGEFWFLKDKEVGREPDLILSEEEAKQKGYKWVNPWRCGMLK